MIELELLIERNTIRITDGPELLFHWNTRRAGTLPEVTVDQIMLSIIHLIKTAMEEEAK